MPRWGRVGLITVVLVLAGLASLSVITVRASFPKTSGVIHLAPLGRPALVERDVYGIPRIYADTAEDLFAAQGFVHAQDRFFEMDVRRHLTAGRLSELFGKSQVETDAYVRTLGWRRVAEQELGLIDQRSRHYLESYAAGVNAYLESRSGPGLSLEYAMLALQGSSYVPEPWTAADSLAWLKAMAWTTSANLWTELEVGVLAAKVGEGRARSILPHYEPKVFRPIVTSGAVRDSAFDPTAQPGLARVAPGGALDEEAVAALSGAAAATNSLRPWAGGTGTGGGSNSWVVAGERTASGKPLLANDPHLASSIPGIFTQVGLHCRTVTPDCPFDVAGFGFSGIPGVVIGHNAHIAWGITNSYVDVQDLVVEQIREGRVRRGAEWVPITTRTEQIRVAGGETQTVTIRETSRGPLLSDVDPTTRDHLAPRSDANQVETAVALQWTALTPSRSVEALFGINEAGDFDQFRRSAQLLVAPSQSLVYADTDGNIGYQLTGAVPVRRGGDGSMPVPGWDPAYGWEAMIPFAELPYAYNPSEGYIVAANQQVIADYPRTLSTDHSFGWRSQRILEVLTSQTEPITPAMTEALFADTDVRFADSIVPSLLSVTAADQAAQDGQQMLAAWNHGSPPNSSAALYFYLVLKHVRQLTFDDEVPEALRTSTGDRLYAVIAELLRDPNNEWWDDQSTPVVEGRDSILVRALANAWRDAAELGGPDPSRWQWGDIHQLRLKHSTLGSSGIGPVEALFNRGDHPVGGGSESVLAWWLDDLDWEANVTGGPVMKMMVDTSDLDSSRWINLSGQSGHAFHPHYADQLPLIARNELLPWSFTRSLASVESVERLELVPRR